MAWHTQSADFTQSPPSSLLCPSPLTRALSLSPRTTKSSPHPYAAAATAAPRAGAGGAFGACWTAAARGGGESLRRSFSASQRRSRSAWDGTVWRRRSRCPLLAAWSCQLVPRGTVAWHVQQRKGMESAGRSVKSGCGRGDGGDGGVGGGGGVEVSLFCMAMAEGGRMGPKAGMGVPVGGLMSLCRSWSWRW